MDRRPPLPPPEARRGEFVLHTYPSMKIAIVIDSLIRGGAERQAFYATSQLTRLGHDVELIYYNRADSAYDPSTLSPAGVVQLAKDGKPLRFVFKLSAHFRRRRFDVVHGWMSMSGVYSGLAGRLAGVPVVFAGYRCEYDSSGMIQRAHRVVNHMVTGWIVNSRATVPSMVRGVGAKPEHVHVVYNGIDPAAFASSYAPVEAKARLGLPPDCLTVTIVGRLRAQKNHTLFLEMAVRVAERISNARFLVVGDGDGDAQTQLEALAARLGVAEHVVFLGSRSDIPDILAATDVMSLTSHYEGVANSLLEAMCVGLPVVSTAYAGVDELVTHGQEGFVAPLGDAESLAGYVAQLLEDSPLRRKMGEAGRRTIGERFSMDAMGRNLATIYERCLNRAKGRLVPTGA